ncbi:MAG TPA: hypothetical protein VJM07_09425 [Gaiella sp.]|nr:hypothetical protein [Gaiella sp.]
MGPAFALAVVVVLAALGYGTAAQLVSMPLLNPDELRYTLAARGLVDGEWLNLRGHEYGLGPLYPVVLAPILALSDSVEAAYPFFKVANAVLFALAAVPIFFVARRLVSPWWSVAVAAMSVAIPSSIYTSLVLTESASYLTFSIALLAVVLALERPSVARQIAMLGAVVLAYATRPQFAILLPAFLVAYAVVWALEAERPRLRAAAARLWPTLGAVVLAIAAFAARPLLTWSSPKESLGGYEDLWRGYDPVSVARFFVYHLAGLELFLFVVPVAVAPIVLSQLLRRGSRRRDVAFAAAFLSVNALLLLVAAAFASTPYGYFQLHERYVFYVAPLWLVVLARWLSSGMPRPFAWSAIGVGLAVALPAVLPFGMIAGDLVTEVVASALWSEAWAFLEGYPLVDGRRALAACVVLLAVAAVAVPRRVWPVVPAVVVAGFLATAVLAWARVVDAPEAFVLADEPGRDWIDEAVPAGARTTKLYSTSSPRCPNSELTRHAFYLTEFFNSSVERSATIGDSIADGLPIERVDVGPSGRFRLEGGEPLVADYVVTQSEIELNAQRVAEGTGAGLVLWKTAGIVELAKPRRGVAKLLSADCG